MNSKSITFSCKAPATAKSVFVAGTFNDWNASATPLSFSPKEGHWTCELQLDPGDYQFKFVVDGEWGCEPGCEHEYTGCSKCVPNEFGTMNRVLKVNP